MVMLDDGTGYPSTRDPGIELYWVILLFSSPNFDNCSGLRVCMALHKFMNTGRNISLGTTHRYSLQKFLSLK
jgi:hypothetical protein